MIRSALLGVLLAVPAFAQTAGPVALGDRIRVHAPESGYAKLVGRVTQTTPDMIGLKVDGSAGEFYVRREQIVFLYRSVGRRRHTVRGLLLGTAIGAALGVWFGPKDQNERALDPTRPNPMGRNAMLGATGGAILGTFAGFATRTDTWVPVTR